MPRKSKRRDEDLVFAAIQAMEDEIRCWREGPSRYYHPGRPDRKDPNDVLTLVRYPRMDLTIGPADYVPEAEATIQHLDMPRKEVPFFLRWQGMEAAIKKVRELEGRDNLPAPQPERVDAMACIDRTASWIA
jgi:hypothetical protein